MNGPFGPILDVPKCQDWLPSKPAEFAGPPELVKLAVDHERVITY